MHIYTVHRRDAGLFAEPEVLLVKEGFCWPAFFFTFLWALWHRMWLVAFLIVVVELAVGAAAGRLGASTASEAVVGLAIMLVVGFSGNDWRRRSLARRRFDESTPVVGRSMEEAELRLLGAERAA